MASFNRPSARKYSIVKDMAKPIPDGILSIVIREYTPSRYDPNVGHSEFTTIFARREIYVQEPELQAYSVEGATLHVAFAEGSRHFHTYYPLSEVLFFEYQHPSEAFNEADDAWHRFNYGMTKREYQMLNAKADDITFEEFARRNLAEKLGVDPDHVHFLDVNSDDEPE